jgi:FecR protein
MNRRSLGTKLLLLASFVSVVFILPAASLDTAIRIVRLSFISGDVQLDRRQGQGYERAIMNMPIVQGSRLWTRGPDALAEVEFEDGSALRLTPDSTVEFQQLSLRDSGEKVTEVELQSGTAYFDVRDQMGDFRVTSGGQQISVSHPARFRVFADQGQFKLAVYKGSLDVRSGENQVAVHNGETFTLNLSDPRQYNLSKNIAEGSYDDWNQQRESYTQSYGAASTYSTDSYNYGLSPAYSYGLADLSYYGNYFYAPGWGWMWQPYYAGTGWNPFMDGAWVWYPQFGYSWVSAYPWGWMPYHYGSWNFVPGYGWAWVPGSSWTLWKPLTPVGHAPPNWGPLRPPGAPPQPGTSGIVTVGRPWGPVNPPAASGAFAGRALLPGNGYQPATNRPVWGPPILNGGATANNGAIRFAPSTAAPSPTPAIRPVGPHPAPISRPAAPPARSQVGAASGASHSSSGGHAGGGWGGHGGGHR